MENVFEVEDKTGRKIRLTKKQCGHITTTHPEMSDYINEIEKTVVNPLKITYHEIGNLRKYYTYQKHRKRPEKYLRVVVKYLNGNGFIITAHFVRNLI